MWENFGSACVVEHRAGIAPDGRIVAWDRENWVASLGNRPGYDQPGNVISGMLLGYQPELPEPRSAKPPAGKLRNRQQHSAILLRRLYCWQLWWRRNHPK